MIEDSFVEGHPVSLFVTDGWDGFSPRDYVEAGETRTTFTRWACCLRPIENPEICLIVVNVPSCMVGLYTQLKEVCEHTIACNLTYYHLHELVHWGQEPEEFFHQADSEHKGTQEYPDWADILNSIAWDFGCV